MMDKKRQIVRKIFIIAGLCLLVPALILLLGWQWNVHRSQQKANAYVTTIRKLVPEPRGALPEERRDNEMAVLGIDGTDFVGILEFPRFDSVLPVCDSWGRPDKYPCRFSGSVYDRTIQIGATSQKGQYEFYRDISVGDSLSFTDMEGNRFSYTVTDIRYEKNADQAALQRRDGALTLFIKNVYALEYIIIYCDVLR